MENMSAGNGKIRGNYYSSEYRGKIDLSSKIGRLPLSRRDKNSLKYSGRVSKHNNERLNETFNSSI